ncbi:disulfide bond formation protein DsbB [Psychrosphaera ytuae]|uniref:Disulfide bond formation protein B n=1 Tax=Psychrosphaera ytuae TaxID=2820710 RepID=A0A975DAT4_9GAMM|nr:disulfide bond formation protein DsbB [Psychrosphaera ytuae]QTH63722.1 disulfide bond formation protein DsbB [Psychrosphaera ytuae]
MSVVHTLSSWPASRWPWLLLAASAFTFEAIALYFQYGMGLEPCIMCVYQRTAVAGILFATIPALINPSSRILRVSSLLAWLVASVWGLKLAIEHVRMQNPDNFMLLMSCDVFPNYPSWMPIHEWLPSVFEPRGTCGDIDWLFLGLSMPQWMVVVFGGYLLMAVLCIGARLIKVRGL